MFMVRLVLFLTLLASIAKSDDGMESIWTGMFDLQDDCLHACDGKPFGYKISDPSDCAAYFLCHGNMIIQQNCPVGEKFNEALQICVSGKCPPCNCDGNGNATVTSPSTGTPTTVDPYAPDCGSLPHGYRLPHSLHCRFFWQCVSRRAVRLFCEIGMWYDRDRFVCNFPAQVKNCPANQD